MGQFQVQVEDCSEWFLSACSEAMQNGKVPNWSMEPGRVILKAIRYAMFFSFRFVLFVCLFLFCLFYSFGLFFCFSFFFFLLCYIFFVCFCFVLKCTWEVSEHSLAFVDIKLSINDNGLSTSVHYKPTDSHIYLLHSSSHPQHVKDAIRVSQFLKNLVLSNELIKVDYHRERFRKLTFRALALRQSK